MKYIEIDIELSKEGIEPVITGLLELGITDTVVQDPSDIDMLMDKENDYEWDYVDEKVLELKNEKPKVTVYFEGVDEGLSMVPKIEAKLAQIKALCSEGVFGDADLGELKVSYQVLDDEDWKDNWKEYFKPAKISEKIVVKPTWYDYERKADEEVIEIDPGMAFGTGTHETTSLCVKMLEKYLKQGHKVLDVGCGSGILAIASAKLGASDVLGIEIDPVAVEIAKENVELNQVGETVKVIEGDLTKGVDYVADVVVANLMADLVMMLSKDAKRHLKKGGVYISSGILNEKVEKVSAAIADCGFEIVEVQEDGMWSAIVACSKQQ